MFFTSAMDVQSSCTSVVRLNVSSGAATSRATSLYPVSVCYADSIGICLSWFILDPLTATQCLAFGAQVLCCTWHKSVVCTLYVGG